MKEIRIHGASDDLLYVNGDELSFWVNGQTYKGQVKITQPDNCNIFVHIIYDGNWAFAVTTSVDFDQYKPDYNRICPAGRGYSEEIVLNVDGNSEIEIQRA